MVPSPKAAELCPYLSLLLPVAGLAVNVLAQILLMRMRRGTQFFRATVEGFLCGLAATVVLEFLLISGRECTGETLAMALLVNIPTYVALSYCSFNFANLGQSSIRIRIYSEICEAPAGILVEQIAREYNEEELIRVRLQRLLESGDLVLRDGRYHIGRSRFVLISRFIFWLKRFILGKASEFE